MEGWIEPGPEQALRLAWWDRQVLLAWTFWRSRHHRFGGHGYAGSCWLMRLSRCRRLVREQPLFSWAQQLACSVVEPAMQLQRLECASSAMLLLGPWYQQAHSDETQ